MLKNGGWIHSYRTNNPGLYYASAESIIDIAIKNGSEEIIEFLANRGINMLNKAVEAGKYSVVDFLISNDFCSFEYNSIDLGTDIRIGISKDNIEKLLRKVKDSKAQINQGSTSLHIAISSRDSNNAKLLIGNGADVNVLDEDGKAPIHFAILQKNSEIVKLLINKGANIKNLVPEEIEYLENLVNEKNQVDQVNQENSKITAALEERKLLDKEDYKTKFLEKFKDKNFRTAKIIDLTESSLNDEDILLLCDELKNNETIERLILRNNQRTGTHYTIYNKIRDVGARALASLLKSNKSIETLDLSGNEISNEGATEFISTLNNNKYIKAINLRGRYNESELDHSLLSTIDQKLEDNKKASRYVIDKILEVSKSMEKQELLVFKKDFLKKLEYYEPIVRKECNNSGINEKTFNNIKLAIKQIEAAEITIIPSEDINLLSKKKFTDETKKTIENKVIKRVTKLIKDKTGFEAERNEDGKMIIKVGDDSKNPIEIEVVNPKDYASKKNKNYLDATLKLLETARDAENNKVSKNMNVIKWLASFIFDFKEYKTYRDIRDVRKEVQNAIKDAKSNSTDASHITDRKTNIHINR